MVGCYIFIRHTLISIDVCRIVYIGRQSVSQDIDKPADETVEAASLWSLQGTPVSEALQGARWCKKNRESLRFRQQTLYDSSGSLVQ